MSAHLDEVFLIAQSVGASVCLTSTADVKRRGVRAVSSEEGHELSQLLVIRPSVAFDRRWDSLARGKILVFALVSNGDLDSAAASVLAELSARLRDGQL